MNYSSFISKCKSGQPLAIELAKELADGALSRAVVPILWVEVTGCAGNTISLMNTLGPNLCQLLLQTVILRYSNSLMFADTEVAYGIMNKYLTEPGGGFGLVVEGAIATGSMENSTVIALSATKQITALEAVTNLGAKADWVVAVGTCASFGGISAANPNPSRSVATQQLLQRPVINVPGCPANPDWITGTLYHLQAYGLPELDALNRPKLFYSETVHTRCPRRSYFDKGIFAQALGDKECMFKLGCKGPMTHADCPVRMWNHYVNWPVKANTPCIGCASEFFPDKTSPFFAPMEPVTSSRLKQRYFRSFLVRLKRFVRRRLPQWFNKLKS